MYRSVHDATETFSEMMSIAHVVGVAIIGLVLCMAKLCKPKEGDIPGPAYLFGLGPTLTYFRFMWLGIPEAATYYLKRYGDFCRVWIQGESVYLISRPSAAYYVMKTNGNNYCTRFGDDTGLRHLGMFKNGIIWNGDVSKWRQLRNVFFQRALNADTLNKATSESVNATKRMVAKLPELRKRTTDGRIEALDFLRRITLDVTNCLTLRTDIQDDEDLVDRIVQYFKAWEYFLIRSPYLYTARERFSTHKKAVENLNEAIHGLVDRKRKLMGEQLRTQDSPDLDFTEHLILSQSRGEVSRDNVSQCVLEMLLAGTDTSSVTMYYLLVSLAENQHIQDKVVAEMKQVLGDDDVTKADIIKLEYLEQALKESMRLKPVGPVVMRRALKDDVIDGHVTPAGTNIIMNLAQMHRRTENFPSPDSFDPDHFAGKNFQKEYIPFGTGPKGCIGQFLAMVEMKAILCTLLRMYRVTSCGQTIASLSTRWDIAQQPTDPSYLFFIPRKEC